jgi:hypothetical protein
MKVIEKDKLCNINGGTTITSTMINAFTNLIKLLKDAGYSLGSGIRRIGEDSLCPLE